MSTPTDQFSNLRLPSGSPDPSTAEDMSFERTSLEERKVIVRDIIASFEPELLPSELLGPGDLERITEIQGNAPRSDWTIHDDLKKTLMLWCCHDKSGWIFLNKLHSSGTRALAFEQKVQRRLASQFQAYDELTAGRQPGTAGQFSEWLSEICEGLESVIRDVYRDVQTRITGQYRAAGLMLDTLEKICRRDEDTSILTRTGRGEGAGPRTVPSLYQEMMQNPSIHLILDALETVEARWPESVATNEALTRMRRIRELLLRNDAPQEYLVQLESLMAE